MEVKHIYRDKIVVQMSKRHARRFLNNDSKVEVKLLKEGVHNQQAIVSIDPRCSAAWRIVQTASSECTVKSHRKFFFNLLQFFYNVES